LLNPPDALKNLYQERSSFYWRMAVAVFFAFGMVGALAARAFYLQVVHHSYFTTKSDDNRMRVTPIPPIRGLVYDRQGGLLAENQPSFNLEVTAEKVADMTDTLARLQILLGLSDNDVARFKERLRKTPRYRSVIIRSNLSAEEVANFEVQRYDFSGVNISAGLSRKYPLAASAAHLMGYVGGISESDYANLDESLYSGINQIGKSGIESSHENDLRGFPGSKIVEANAGGRPLRELETRPGKAGNNLYLSLDTRLQLTAEAALGEDDGAVVAIDPKTGEILALVSKPGFDPHLFVDGINSKTYRALNADRSRPLFNRALQGQYPPGSTIKPFMLTAGLQWKEVTPEHRVRCSGTYYLPGGGRKFRCHKRSGHGFVDANGGMMKSCDVYFYQLALGLGIDKIDDSLAAFGFGRKTGLDIPNENTGLLPTREWKRRVRKDNWYPGETLNIGIGQGYLTVTPLQMAQATARIAMQGRGFRPHLVHAIQDQSTGAIQKIKPEALPPMSTVEAETWQRVIGSMEMVAQTPGGTAYRIGHGAAYRIAGKTGTAQVSGLSQEDKVAPKMEEVAKHLRDHAWFMAFAPADDPKIAIAVIAEHAGHGGAAAAPIARQVMDVYLTGQVQYQPDPAHPLQVPPSPNQVQMPTIDPNEAALTSPSVAAPAAVTTTAPVAPSLPPPQAVKPPSPPKPVKPVKPRKPTAKKPAEAKPEIKPEAKPAAPETPPNPPPNPSSPPNPPP
jgi:penicillin-binding protein 2